MKPPIKAPAMPIKMVTMMPPGSGPGMIHFASTPAISPTTINAKIPMRFHLPLVNYFSIRRLERQYTTDALSRATSCRVIPPGRPI